MPTIAIVGLSAYAQDQTQVTRAVMRLQERGWTVINLVNPLDKTLRFAATDDARLAQLQTAIDNPQVDIVLALRGGYGLSRLMDQIDFDKLAASGKLFCGFSDFTLIHLGLLSQSSAISFAGPMLYDDLGSEICHEFSFDQFKHCLHPKNGQYRVEVAVEGNPTLQVQGLFWGGNLAMLTHAIGSKFMPSLQQIDNGILFIEDVNENPYRIERMLLQLHHAGYLARQQAIVLGHFTNYKSTEYDNGYDFNAMLNYIADKTKLPIIQGLPFGHCANKVTLPIGAQVKLKSDAAGFTLEFNHYPHL